MAAPSWESKGADFSNTSAAPSFAVPAGTAANKIAIVSMFVNVLATTVTGVPVGFAAVPGTPVDGGSNRLFKYWKRLTGADAGTYDFTLSASQFIEGAAELYNTVVLTGNPFDPSPGFDKDDTPGTVTPPVGTISTGSDRLIIHSATDWAGGVWTPSALYTKRVQPPVGLVTTSDKVQAVAGPTGAISATCTGNDKRTAHIIALIGTTVDTPPVVGGSVANTVGDSTKRAMERAISTADGGTGEGMLTLDNRDSQKFQSAGAYGTATAPGANAAIATIAAPPAGYYKISAEVSMDAGAPAAGDRDNMELRAGVTVLKKIIINPVVSPAIGFITEFYRTLDGSTALTINATGAGTASVVYRASLTATRIS